MSPIEQPLELPHLTLKNRIIRSATHSFLPSEDGRMTNEEYGKYVDRLAPKSKCLRNCLNAFWVGGLICVVGQLLISLTRLTPARILVLFVTLGVLLGALGLYAPLVDFAGAGASVPLTGFGYSLAKGAIRAARQNGVIGAFTGGITATAGGVAAAIAFGYLFSLLSRSKTKK